MQRVAQMAGHAAAAVAADEPGGNEAQRSRQGHTAQAASLLLGKAYAHQAKQRRTPSLGSPDLSAESLPHHEVL